MIGDVVCRLAGQWPMEAHSLVLAVIIVLAASASAGPLRGNDTFPAIYAEPPGPDRNGHGPDPGGRDYISRASYTSTEPPPVSTGQPVVFAVASPSESAVTME